MTTQEEINEVGWWFHNIKFPNGLETKPGSEYPRGLWKEALEFLPDLQDKTVLDIGCNGGYMEIELDKLGAQVTAIDREQRYVNQTNLTKREFDLNCEVLLADLEELHLMPEFSGRKFDVVLLLGVIYHVDNPIRALSNTLNLAKEMVLMETDISTLPGSVAEFLNYPEKYRYTWRPTKECIHKLIACAGGEVQAERVRPHCAPRTFIKIAPTGNAGILRV